MATDIYKAEAFKRGDPANNAAAITPSDTEELTYAIRAIYVGGIGDITLVTLGGDTVTFVDVPGGTVLPVSAKQVLASGTDATNLVGLW